VSVDARQVADAVRARCPELADRVWPRSLRPAGHPVGHVVVDSGPGADVGWSLAGRPSEDRASWALVCCSDTGVGAERLARLTRAALAGWRPPGCTPARTEQGPVLRDDEDPSDWRHSCTVVLHLDVNWSLYG
jgi:hypothetical protein